MTEQEYQEQQEQMSAAAQLIIDGAQEAKDFKSGGQSYKAAAETYKTLNDKAIDRMSKRPEAIVPESVYQNIQNRAAAGVRSEKCQTPTSEDMVPILRAAYKEVGPEIQYKKVIKIHGKLWFWLAVPMLIAAGILYWLNYRQIHFGTPESWANRNYITAVELNDANPGNYYDEIIHMFDADHGTDAKEIVKTREEKMKSFGKTSKEFEEWISGYLVNVDEFKEGIKVFDWEQKKENGKKVTFIRFRNLNTQEEWKMIQTADGHTAFTTDENILTLKDATNRRNSQKKIWGYQGYDYPYTYPKKEQ